MAIKGLPGINIVFQSKGGTAVARGSRGKVAMILHDESLQGAYVLTSAAQLPEGVTENAKEYVNMVFNGGISALIVYFINDTGTKLAEAQKYLETTEFDYFCYPECSQENETGVAGFIKTLRDSVGKKVKGVFANQAADHEGIINFCTENIEVVGKTYTAKQYTPRIAGLLAGLSLTRSATNVVLGEVIDCDRLTKEEQVAALQAGKFVLVNDGTKVKVLRGINSYVSTSDVKGEQFSKIRNVEIMDMIEKDITATVNDSYIGAVNNTYMNKVILIAAINGYFDQLQRDGLLDLGSECKIDIDAQRSYLEVIGKYDAAMTDEDIAKANTRDQVFLVANVVLVDSMEAIELRVHI